MTKFSTIHVWLPGIFDFKGGIQIYSTFFLQALEQISPNSNRHIFLKNDRPKINNLGFDSQTQFHFSGQWKSTPLHTVFFSIQILLGALFNRPDMIVCGHVNFSPLAAKITNLFNIPYWVIVHGVDVWNLKDSRKITGLKSADKIVSVSQYTRDRLLQEQALNPEKIVVLPNTFDASRLQIAPKPQYLLEKYHLQSDQPVILTIARLAGEERYKGYDQIIRALPEIIASVPNVHYLIGGKGGDRPRIEKFIQELNLENYVTLAGFIPDEELADHYNLCDVFAMPSKGEGFGIVYLEALACGKPTLGGNQDGAIDALCNGELGVLVDPDDLTEISTAITQILKKTYPFPILYQAETLRQKVIEIYGFAQFKHNLAQLLATQFSQPT
ncbi:glycosyltransferase [Picosynechococcus sp. PCC 73109]|uniref:glycosyltransferase n=1 Tax=Picosynechococcus sp. PCC 73109 TaxID=374982 RepID=UPI00074585DE|nr:glycosyltransferase [Picosynechococcus sp. PCC 73109]AMA09221.1 glycosyltransferase [Picosynechococcus sp. PCC 73109]